MNVLYIGKIIEESLFKIKETKKKPFFVAQFTFEKALYSEMKKYKGIEIEVVSIYQTDYYPKDKLLFNRKGGKFNYLSFVNLPYLREITYFISTIFKILRWYISNRNEKQKFIFATCHFPPVSLAIVLVGKILRIKKILTLTDLPVFTYSREKINKMKLYKKIFMKPYVNLVNLLQKKYDGYIFFSKEMNQKVNINNKPFLVLEGIYNNEDIDLKETKEKSRAIAHAGTLNKEVGIEMIINVFDLIKDENLELWLIGNGDMVDHIKEKAKMDKRIKYYGYLPREEVFRKLKEASLLLNLRNPKDVYTKYSFPSKMFEYMVSGTPVLTTKLNGIPNEYFKYVYTVEKYDAHEIKSTIEDILYNMQENERRKIALEAREFILSTKNKQKQVARVVNFLNQNIK